MPASATAPFATAPFAPAPFAPAGSGMMSAIADRLAPLFASDKIEAPAARQIALAAIDEYRPEAGIDFVNIARVLAFSMSAVELLRQALAQGVTLKDQMRMFGRANALNRSAEQSERTMMQRRKQHRTQAHAARGTLPPEPVLDPAAVEAAVAEAIAVHDELRAKTAPPPPAPEPAVKRDPTPTQPEPAIERDPGRQRRPYRRSI